MERLRTEQPKGLNRSGLRKWAMLFVALGVFGRCILQNRYLCIAGMTTEQLLDAMTGSSEVMTAVTIAMVLQFVECCAAPIFCMLAADGMAYTAKGELYIARVLGVAVLSEIPYNFAMSGKFLDLSGRNPVFGILMGLILLYLYQRFAENRPVNFLYKVAFTVAAFFWVAVLKIENGLPSLVLILAFWLFRKKPTVRNLVAGGISMFCSLYSIYFMAAPMGMLILHFYNGKKEEEENKPVNYLFYPLVLVVFAVVGALAF